MNDIYSDNLDAALDAVLKTFDDLFLAGKFDEANSFLMEIDVNRLSVSLMVGILTATLPAKTQLPSRPTFVATIEAALRQIEPQRVERLLIGLR